MTPFIAKWFKNSTAAISIRFDDASETHVSAAIPLLDRYGFVGTFMINPGRSSYQKHKRFWEEKIPKTVHSLGNHTWNHRGAKNMEEADFEIGSVSRLIWSLYPKHSKLTVFASGGGERWGGKRWSEADPSFRTLIDKYHLIDLYDGNHSSLGGDSTTEAKTLCAAAIKAIENRQHQPFHFHSIGIPYTTVKGVIRKIIYGHDISFSKTKFEKFLECLSNLRQDIWNAPLIDILKYETEYNSAKLVLKEKTAEQIRLEIIVLTHSELYDHPLTLVIPGSQVVEVHQKIENDFIKINTSSGEKASQADIQPIRSEIIVNYHPRNGRLGFSAVGQ